jgi:hypothetical protein
MHPQLQAIVDDFGRAETRLHRLVAALPSAHWNRRPEPARWSVAECVAHLNLTAAACVPRLLDAFERGRRTGEPAPRRYRRDPIGWLLWRLSGPPVKQRVRTAAPFEPGPDLPREAIMAEFARRQREQVAMVAEADGLPLGRLWIISPFDPRIRYNAYACLTILPSHQHRHLWQAEQVRAALPAA